MGVRSYGTPVMPGSPLLLLSSEQPAERSGNAGPNGNGTVERVQVLCPQHTPSIRREHVREEPFRERAVLGLQRDRQREHYRSATHGQRVSGMPADNPCRGKRIRGTVGGISEIDLIGKLHEPQP